MSTNKFPTDRDFKHRSPTEGFYALIFFPNGLGAKISRHYYSYKPTYTLTLLRGNAESYTVHSNHREVLVTEPWGYNYTDLQKALAKIRNYEPNK